LPHVVLQGPISLDACISALGPFMVRDGDFLAKGERLYRDSVAPTLLVEILLVDRGHTQKFFIQVAGRNSDVIVRLEPLTDPEKTPGVRRALAIVANRIRMSTGATYGQTNIEEYLIR